MKKSSKDFDDETEVEKEQQRDASSSLTRMLSILDLFTLDHPVWSTNDILSALGASRSTGYRYIREMTSAGLLGAVGNGYYMLGPRIIELDLQIRLTDPLLQASEDVLEELTEATGHSSLLCMLYQNSVLCVRECRVQLCPITLIDRGQRRPLFKGAMSKVILAHLPSHRLQNIFLRRQEEISDAHLGQKWDEFRDLLANIRSDGYVKSAGEFTPEVAGIAAPIFNAEQAVIGSVGIAMDMSELSDLDLDRAILSVKRAGRTISSRMASGNAGPVLGPRAVG